MKRKWKENERKDEVCERKKKREWKKEQQSTNQEVFGQRKRNIQVYIQGSSRKEQKIDQNRCVKYEEKIRRNLVKGDGEVDK